MVLSKVGKSTLIPWSSSPYLNHHAALVIQLHVYTCYKNGTIDGILNTKMHLPRTQQMYK
jgi:hypothetical protein